jgi:hypothetical protein
MSQTQKRDRTASLLTALTAVPTTQESTSSPSAFTSEETAPEPQRPALQATPRPKATRSTRKGQGIHFYFSEDDEKRVRILAAFLSSQGEKFSDSLIVKTSLRVVQPNNAFLAAYQEAKKADRRRSKTKV